MPSEPLMDDSASGDGFISGVHVFCRSAAIVGVAELFDKTWFMGLLLALRYRKVTVFAGSVTALLLHTVLAAVLGYAFAKVLSQTLLSFMTVALFTLFALMYAKDWYCADPDADAIAEGTKEAAEDCELPASKAAEASNLDEDADEGCSEVSSTDTALVTQPPPFADYVVFGKSFMAVFIAEWGDRTQIAMVGQHASQPLVPVFLGSALAFVLLTLSAVLAASVLSGQKLSERLVYGISTICFTVFALLALKDAISTLGDDSSVSVES